MIWRHRTADTALDDSRAKSAGVRGGLWPEVAGYSFRPGRPEARYLAVTWANTLHGRNLSHVNSLVTSAAKDTESLAVTHSDRRPS
jgi:hypothetical protein